MVRQDLSEDERFVLFLFPSYRIRLMYNPLPNSGVKLILDIGVIDTATCEPLENVFVELWSGEEYLTQLDNDLCSYIDLRIS